MFQLGKNQKPENALKEPENRGQGLKLDKKTVFFITGIILVIMIFVGALTQFIPRGEYKTDENGSIIASVTDPVTGEQVSTYNKIDFKMPFWKTFVAPIEVFTSSEAITGVAVILFIILIGGTFLILDKSGVLTYIMSVIVKKYSDKNAVQCPESRYPVHKRCWLFPFK